uniref:Uncharacterized protein n=1 Tax=Phlebotomus papatasi TaxID=29031 RepID=A0A1B0CZC1_PHLPP
MDNGTDYASTCKIDLSDADQQEETNNPTAVEKRGRHPPKLKTPAEDRNFAREFIEAIPA